MNKKLEKLKSDYMDTPIPTELDFVVNKALQQSNKKNRNAYKKWIIGTAAAAVLFITGLNTNATFAKAMSDLPVVGQVMKVFTFVEYKIEEKRFYADVKIPAIESDNNELDSTLNKKYLEESQQLFKEFSAEMEELKEKNGGNIGVDSGYRVVTDTDQIFVIERYVFETAASGYETLKYDTIDKKNQLLITLPSLFKNDSYINVISENIKEQMKTQMKEDESKIYWIKGDHEDDFITDQFQSINKNQSFYINAENKLVIVFNEYEVAPGYMGTVQFVVPTDVIKDLLVSDEYIH